MKNNNLNQTARMKKEERPVSINVVLKQLLKNDKKLTEALIFSKLEKGWTKIADRNLFNNAGVYRYQNYVLTINCRNSSWAQQLEFLKEKIKEEYAKLYPRIIIKNMKFVCAEKMNMKQKKEKTNNNDQDLAEKEKKIAGELAGELKEKKQKEQLVKIISKDKKYRRTMKRKKCRDCGEDFVGSGASCNRCDSKKNSKIYTETYNYLSQAPWSQFSDISVDIQGSREEIYLMTKKSIKNRLFDKIKNLSFEFQKGRSLKKKRILKEMCERYTMLKTGLSPAQLAPEIIENAVGKRIYRLLL